MKNSILLILAVCLVVALGCGEKTETDEDQGVLKKSTVEQTSETAVESDARGVEEEKAIQEISITIKEGQFEPSKFDVEKGDKIRFKVIAVQNKLKK